jgi:hypothetical protein
MSRIAGLEHADGGLVYIMNLLRRVSICSGCAAQHDNNAYGTHPIVVFWGRACSRGAGLTVESAADG